MWKPRCMNLRSRWRKGKWPSSGSSRRELDHADEHQRRDLAGAARHRQDHAGQDAGHARAAARCAGSSATSSRRSASDPSRIPPGTAASAFLGGDDHDRHREQRQRERGPQDAARAEGRRRAAPRRRTAVDAAADEVDEEAEAEDAEDDGRHAGEVVDGDAHGADEHALARVLAQVERGEHAERHDEQCS